MVEAPEILKNSNRMMSFFSLTAITCLQSASELKSVEYLQMTEYKSDFVI